MVLLNSMRSLDISTRVMFYAPLAKHQRKPSSFLVIGQFLETPIISEGSNPKKLVANQTQQPSYLDVTSPPVKHNPGFKVQ